MVCWFADGKAPEGWTHSKSFALLEALSQTRQRLGLRQPSAAFASANLQVTHGLLVCRWKSARGLDALQKLRPPRGPFPNAPASWTAAAPCRFCFGKSAGNPWSVGLPME